MMDLSKILDKKNVIFIPIGIMVITIVVTIGSVVMSRVKISNLSKEYATVQEEYEKLKADKDKAAEAQTKAEEDITSAFSDGEKIAKYQTRLCDNASILLKADNGLLDESVDVDAAKKDAQSQVDEQVNSLSKYFSDDSYKNAWYTSLTDSSVKWTFDTKYNFNVSDKEVTVLWRGDMGSYDETFVAYVTAVYNTETAKFSKATVVSVNSPVIANGSKLESSDLLTLLNSDKVMKKHDVVKSTENTKDDAEKQDTKTEDQTTENNATETTESTENQSTESLAEESSDDSGIQVEESSSSENTNNGGDN